MKRKIILRKSAIPASFLLILFLVVSFFNKHLLASEKDLQILSAIPRGTVQDSSEAESIQISFGSPMVPLGASDEEKFIIPLKISPKIRGKFRWAGTSTLILEPFQRLPFGTSYKVTVPAGTTSLDGKTLAQNYTWSFETLRPRVRETFPSDGANWVHIDDPFLVVFNQKVNIEKAKKYVHLADESGKEIHVNISYPEKNLWKKAGAEPASGGIAIAPERVLEKGKKYILSLLPGIPGMEGSLGMQDPHTTVFETIGPLAFTGPKSQKIEPDTSIVLDFTNPVLCSDVLKHLHVSPSMKETRESAVCFSKDFGDWAVLNLPLMADTRYEMSLDNELQDQFGQHLTRNENFEINVQSYPPNVSMTSGFGVIESEQNLYYPLWIRNAPRVGLEMALVKPDQVIPVIDKLRENENDCCYDSFFFQTSKPLAVSKSFWKIARTWKLPKARQAVPVPIRLEEALGRKNRHGIVLVQVNALPAFGERAAEPYKAYPKALLECTSLGISAKFSAISNLVWVTRLKDTLPAQGAVVEIRDEKNRICWHGKTNAQGFVKTPGWKKLGIALPKSFWWESPVQYVFVKSGDDFAFSSSRWQSGIYPYEFGIAYNWYPEPQQYAGYLFTDRPVYKEGEKVYLKGIFRLIGDKGWKIPHEKINLEIRDSRGQVSFQKKGIKVSDWGSFHLPIPISENAPTGYYEIMASFHSFPGEPEYERRDVFRTSFQVAAYRPLSFKIKIKPANKAYFPGETIKTGAEARYLFGAPLSRENIQWNWTKSRSFFSPPGKEGFVFESWLSEDSSDYRYIPSENGKGVLDKNGFAQIQKKIVPKGNSYPALYNLEVTARGEDRQEVSQTTSFLVHPAHFYAGIQASSIFAKQGELVKVKILACTPSGKNLPGKKFKLSAVHQEWVSVRKAGFGGRYEWISHEKKNLESSSFVVTKEKPVTVEFRPKSTGYYILKLEGRDAKGNPVRTSTYFYSAGTALSPWKEEEDDRIGLVADKKTYKPGDTARILIKSPYPECRALVTLEREGIISARNVPLRGTSPEITVPITQNLIPNAFVGVILIHGRAKTAQASSQDLGKPSFKIGYVNLPVDPTQNHLKVNVETSSSSYRPGEMAEIRIRVKDPSGKGKASEVSIAAVDEGVLSLVGMETPDPFEAFYAPRPLSVQTSETRINVVGQRHYGEKGESPGGGGGIGNQIFYRGNFLTTPYWNPAVHTDENGTAVVRFKLPDNLTTFRVMAVAQSRDSCFGSGEKLFRVSKPLVLLPDFPRFLRKGDRFKGGVVVENNSGKSGDVVVFEKAAGLQKFHLHAGESREVRFPFSAKSLGKMQFYFSAKMANESDALRIAVPVVLDPELMQAEATSGDMDSGNRKEWLKLPGASHSDSARLELSLSSTAMLQLKEGARYLLEYPYGCFEQRSSRIFPIVLGTKIIEAFNLEVLEGKSPRDVAQKEINNLSQYQTPGGGFSLWPGERIPYPYLTAYGVVLLEEAKKRGYRVDEKMLEKAENYLKEEAKGFVLKTNYPYSAEEWDTIDAFAVYALSRKGMLDPGIMQRLYRGKNNLSYFSLALLYKAMANQKFDPEKINEIKRILENGIKVDPVSAHVEEPGKQPWVFDSNERTTAAVLQAFLEIDGGHPLASKMVNWLLKQRKNGYWRNTQDNTFILWALSDYFDRYEKETPDLTAQILLQEKELLKAEFHGRSSYQARASKAICRLQKNESLPVSIVRKGSGRLYFELRVRYALKGNVPSANRGLAVSRQLETLHGKKLDPTKIKAGEILRMVILVSTKQDRYNVALVDKLPAGFEPINESFLTERKNLSERNFDLYESYWWTGFNHCEKYDDRLFFSSDFLQRGTHTISYLVRATGIGTFNAPPAHVEEMYNPEVFGRTGSTRVVIKEGGNS